MTSSSFTDTAKILEGYRGLFDLCDELEPLRGALVVPKIDTDNGNVPINYYGHSGLVLLMKYLTLPRDKGGLQRSAKA